MAVHSQGRMPALNAQSKATATRRGAIWTEEEDTLLRASKPHNDHMFAVATELKRTLGSVMRRYYILADADAEGRAINYAANRADMTYTKDPGRKKHSRIFIAPACACADPWEHRDWCPALTPTSTEGESNVHVLNPAYTQDQARTEAA